MIELYLYRVAELLQPKRRSIALVNGSATATISGGGTAPVIESDTGDKYLIVRAGRGQHYVNATDGSAGTDDYNITATLTACTGSNRSSFFYSLWYQLPLI